MEWRDMERCVPGMNNQTFYEAAHMARYAFAAKQWPTGLILDCGCGSGYGDPMLVDEGLEVVAGDMCIEAVEEANRLYPAGPRLAFDAEKLSFADDVFDAAVCFEVIEHVQDPDALCGELARVVKPGGAVLVSTPPKDNPCESHHVCRHHLRLYAREELERQLLRHFPAVEILTQSTPFELATSAAFHPLNRAVIRIKRLLGIEKKLAHQALWNGIFKRIAPGPEWAVTVEDLLPKPNGHRDVVSMLAVCTNG